MKKIKVIKYFLILSIICIFMILSLKEKTTYILQPHSEKIIRVKGHSESLDSIIRMTIKSQTVDGRIKLSYGDNWFNSDNDINYNIDTSQIEKYEYDFENKKMNKIILQNPFKGIEVDNTGIIITTPIEYSFSFNSKLDFFIKLQNVSNKEVTVDLQITYK